MQEIVGKTGCTRTGVKAEGRGGRSVDEDVLGELTGINAEIKRTLVLKKQLVERIKKNPEAASRLIQNWVSAE